MGTKEGGLDVLDVGASSKLQSVEAHSGAVWSLAALPDNRSALWCSVSAALVKHASNSEAVCSDTCAEGEVVTAEF